MARPGVQKAEAEPRTPGRCSREAEAGHPGAWALELHGGATARRTRTDGSLREARGRQIDRPPAHSAKLGEQRASVVARVAGCPRQRPPSLCGVSGGLQEGTGDAQASRRSGERGKEKRMQNGEGNRRAADAAGCRAGEQGRGGRGRGVGGGCRQPRDQDAHCWGQGGGRRGGERRGVREGKRTMSRRHALGRGGELGRRRPDPPVCALEGACRAGPCSDRRGAQAGRSRERERRGKEARR